MAVRVRGAGPGLCRPLGNAAWRNQRPFSPSAGCKILGNRPGSNPKGGGQFFESRTRCGERRLFVKREQRFDAPRPEDTEVGPARILADSMKTSNEPVRNVCVTPWAGVDVRHLSLLVVEPRSPVGKIESRWKPLFRLRRGISRAAPVLSFLAGKGGTLRRWRVKRSVISGRVASRGTSLFTLV